MGASIAAHSSTNGSEAKRKSKLAEVKEENSALLLTGFCLAEASKNALGSVEVIDSSAITLMYCLSYLKEIKGGYWNFGRSIAWFSTLWLQ